MAEARAGQHRVVVAGGGVAALEAVLALRAIAGSDPVITMVAPNADFIYQPMSVGEPFAIGPTPRLPLADFASDQDAELRVASVKEVAPTHAVILEEGGFAAFDKLIVAIGAPRVAVFEHATTFRGDDDTTAVHGLVQDIEMGAVHSIAFVVPTGVAWSLPLYELALMSARRAFEMQIDVEITIVTPEERPLIVFGDQAAADTEQLLAAAKIRLLTRSVAEVPERGHVLIHPGGDEIRCERVIALPVTRGPGISGLPHDADGFLPIDSNARVVGVEDVYGAGDGTNFPLKQGGIATQQADAAVEHIAWSFGLGPQPEPFRPVLRGRLLTGVGDHFMQRDVSARAGHREESEDQPLWYPSTKVAGKYLSAYLADNAVSR